jgi:hypothetical protein
MVNKEIYGALCDKSKDIPLYSHPWWLDCVCGAERWDVLLFAPKGEIEAVMPYYMPCRGVITMPPFTQTLGVWFNPAMEETQPKHRLRRRQTVCEELINQLPPFHFFLQRFSSDFTDWLPFYWNGFRQTTRYNFTLQVTADRKEVWNGISPEIRQNINKARDRFKLTIDRDISTKDFLRLYAAVFQRQNGRPYMTDMLESVINTAVGLNKGFFTGARDPDGRLHAAAFFVEEGDTVWYLASGSDPALRNSGATPFLLWESIVSFSLTVRRFDFEGSMLRGVSDFFRRFGAVPVPYFSIEKGKLTLWDRIRIKL